MGQEQGIFISFDSGDGSGKTTQIDKLRARLVEKGIEMISTREPGGTLVSDKIRAILLDPENNTLLNETEILLYAASRAQHVNEKIIPALLQNKVVICDRYVDSSIAYQGYGLEIDPMIVWRINEFAIKGLMPCRTYMIQVPTEISLERLRNRNQLDRIEQRESKYHQNCLNGFARIAQQNPSRVMLLDGTKTIDELSNLIWDDFKQIYMNIRGVQL
jgi:dTMP kinase